MVSNDIHKKEYEAPRFKFIGVQFQGIGLKNVPQGVQVLRAGLKYRRRTKGIQQPADVKVCRLCYILYIIF